MREAKHTRIHVLLIFDDNFDPQMPDYMTMIYITLNTSRYFKKLRPHEE